MRGGPYRITIGHRAAVCGLVLAGVPFGEACKIAGAPKAPLHKVLPKNWVGNLYPVWTPATRAAMKVLWDADTKVEVIAEKYRTSNRMVYRIAREEGWPLRRSGPKRHNPVRFLDLPPERRAIYRKMRQIMSGPEAMLEALR